MSEDRVVRVLPDVPAIDKEFDYLVPDAVGGQVRVGSEVRVELNGRRVGAWVVADAVVPPVGVALRPLAKVRGWGPPPSVLDLAAWAAWRWAGRRATLLGTASSERAVPVLRSSARSRTVAEPAGGADLAARLLAEGGASVLRLPPAADQLPAVLAAVAVATAHPPADVGARADGAETSVGRATPRGGAAGTSRAGGAHPKSAAERGLPALVLVPSAARADWFARRRRAAGVAPVAVLPRDWDLARSGEAALVVGSRAAAWAPCPAVGAVVVLDEHDEVYQEERTPTWHARDVVVERARRDGAPCLLVSAVPTLEALAVGPLHTVPRSEERAGWPVVEVVDQREADPARSGPISAVLARVVGEGRRVVCVLNRKGRSRLLACAACGSVATCEACEAAVAQGDDGALACPRCATVRPALCLACGATRFKNLRMGVTRLREELEALAGEPVIEVTGATVDREAVRRARLVVGTEAVLHGAGRADVVAFIDLDQELLAPRYRAAEQALGLLARGARVVGGRQGGGRLLLQTRNPDHEVVRAVVLGDPSVASAAEAERRALLRFPPVTALAEVSGPAAPAFIEALGRPRDIDVLGPDDGRWILRAADHAVLCGALAAIPRPPGRLRLGVDPLRI